MRKQYYFQPSPRGTLAWDVDHLIALSADLQRRRIPLADIRELDEDWFGKDERPTWRNLLNHLKLIDEADLSFPIIVSAEGRVMDGMHRVAKALSQGRHDIETVRFEQDPPPDHIGREPNDLPY